MIDKITADFIECFNETPQLFRSPGRVNILGEHTDYNEGFVLPAAIDKSIYIAISKRKDTAIQLYSADFNESFFADITAVEKAATQWPNYILGVVDQLLKHGCTLGGFNLVIDGDIPIGAGLSSSAAVECAVAFALDAVFELGLDKLDMVKYAQKAEHVFAGVNCGIMDQFASMFGKKGHAIKLDCRSLAYEYIPLQLPGYKIVLLNTNVKHNLAASEYNVRRQQCEAGISLVQKKYPQVSSLRDATIAMLDELVAPVDELVYRRCKFIVEENERLLTACEALKKGDMALLGQKMFATHAGLSTQYQVSCKELDFLVARVQGNPAVAGARMMGGGFGGCTINLVKEEAIPGLVKTISAVYEKEMRLPLTAYVAAIGDGAAVVG